MAKRLGAWQRELGGVKKAMEKNGK
jgi:hypothetical protein